ncbi:MAG: mechanosensitive ion channel [Hyphomicrobiales bacterium]|nr:mechanosensitive ion channel [Hyphomicrobiales bacterium]
MTSQQNRLGFALGVIVLAMLLLGLPASAQSDLFEEFDEPYPLRAADTSSPRDTLRSFVRDFSATVDAWRAGKPSSEILRPMARAADTLNLSDVTALGRESTTLIDMALLREVLDRVELPQYEDIPGDDEVAANESLNRWVVPDTKIEIARVTEGPRAGQFLFSRDTVAEIRNYYELASEIPYKAGAIVGIYEEILASPGRWLPQHFPDALPAWATIIVGGQGVWQWIAVVLLIGISAVLFLGLIRLGLYWDRRWWHRGPWLRFGLPLALLLVIALSEIDFLIAQNAIGLLELPLNVVAYAALAVEVIIGSWLVLVLSGRLADAIGQIGSRADRTQRIDTALMRILFRLISVVIMLLLAVAAADAIGIPIAPLVAGLGVGGLAIALAVRPTLENVIGGLTLFADRPVRVGDLCSFGNEIGTVEQIGLRSTRIRTLEKSIVTVPNSEFSQMHLDNYTARFSRLLRTVLQLRYETTPEQMRFALAKLRELLIAHPKVLPDPARVRFIGYGPYSKDIEVFTYLRCQDQDTFLAIQEDILLRMEDIVAESGSGFAFPSQTTYYARDDGIDAERGREAAAQVDEWRGQKRFPFPDFDPGVRAGMEDRLDYPPKGAHDYRPPGEKVDEPPSTVSEKPRRRRWAFARSGTTQS